MPQRVVTLPPQISGAPALSFAREAKRRGADLLELRTDLHADRAIDTAALAEVLPLIVSERGRSLSQEWVAHAALADRPVEAPEARATPCLASHHADAPMPPEDALALWRRYPLAPGSSIKHVEPLGKPADGFRLLRTRQLLRELAGHERVTVLATGPLALPYRCVLAEDNALDYVAAGPEWMAAPGQRLLADAVRAARARPDTARLGILGSGIPGSRSPRIHPPPFDRLDLPADAPVGEIVDALRPFYAGFAITSPFKKVLARHVGSPLEAINTLVRSAGGWSDANTDVDGARAVLERLVGDTDEEVTVLGDGGSTAALRLAAESTGSRLRVLKRADITATPVTGHVVWTWPDRIEAPGPLAFAQAKVAIIAYGAPARRIAAEVRRRGGVPMMLGAHWFVAQARGQRRLWEDAT